MAKGLFAPETPVVPTAWTIAAPGVVDTEFSTVEPVLPLGLGTVTHALVHHRPGQRDPFDDGVIRIVQAHATPQFAAAATSASDRASNGPRRLVLR